MGTTKPNKTSENTGTAWIPTAIRLIAMVAVNLTSNCINSSLHIQAVKSGTKIRKIVFYTRSIVEEPATNF